MVLDCAPERGSPPSPGVSGTPKEPKGPDVVGPNQLREAQATDAVGSLSGRREALQPETERRSREIGFNFCGRAHLDN